MHIKLKETIYLSLLILSCFSFVSPALALLLGVIFALTFGCAYPSFNKKVSKYLLQISVVGLGFGMNVHSAIAAGKDGFLFTLISVTAVIVLGIIAGKVLRVEKNISYLISSGTAICGGSAIAAVAPIIKADEHDIAVSMGTVFLLNAAALFLFPYIGHLLNLTQNQFGMWSAIAIHDTSSVVGAASIYGKEALATATTVKLTRALWIIPLSVATSLIFKNDAKKIYLPYFILFFIAAMCINTFLPVKAEISSSIVYLSKRALSVTLFMIGTGLSIQSIKKVGIKPLILGIILWFVIAAASLILIIKIY